MSRPVLVLLYFPLILFSAEAKANPSCGGVCMVEVGGATNSYHCATTLAGGTNHVNAGSISVPTHACHEEAMALAAGNTVMGVTTVISEASTCYLNSNSSIATCGHGMDVQPPAVCPAGYEKFTSADSVIQCKQTPAPQVEPCSSKPIYFRSGNKYLEFTDYQGQGPFPLRWTRYYNSQVQGEGWTFSYLSERLKVNTYSAQLTLARGRQISFFSESAGWRTFANEPTTLVEDTVNNEWVVMTSDDVEMRFDSNGYLVKLTNRAGQTQTITRAVQSNPNGDKTTVTVTDYAGRTLTIEDDHQLDYLLMTDPGGNEYKYTYLSALKREDLTPETVRYAIEFVTFPDETPLDESNNPKIQYQYGTQIVSDTLGFTGPHTHPHTGTGANPLKYYFYYVTGVIDELGNTYATYAYDSNWERATSSELAGGVEKTVVGLDGNGDVLVTNPLGKQATYEFDNNLIKKIDGHSTALCNATTVLNTYDSNGYLDNSTDENGVVTDYDYNAAGLVVSMTEAVGTAEAVTTTQTWHANHRVKTSEVRPGQRIDFTYDSEGRLLTRTVKDLQTQTVPYTTTNNTRTTTYTYNSFGLVATMDGPRTDVNDTTTYEYETNGDLKKIINPLGHTVEILSRNARGYVTALQDQNSVRTDVSYDPRGRVTEIKRASSQGDVITGFTYDARGLLVRVDVPSGGYLTYEYDNAQRLIATSNDHGERVEYTLDNASNITKIEQLDRDGSVLITQQFVFDELSRLRDVVDGVNNTTSYAYDNKQNPTSETDALLRNTGTNFDALERVSTVTDAATGVTTYTYDGRGNVASVTDARNVQTTYTYDGLDNLIQEASPDAGTTVYHYDAAGNMTQMVDGRGVVTNLTYDALNRLTAETYPAASAENVAYTYDSGSNGVGRLTSFTDESGSTSYSYDDRGNVTTETRVIDGTTYVTSYTYDLADQILTTTYPSGRIVTVDRDSLGRETSLRHTLSGVTEYLVDAVQYGAHGLLEAVAYGNGLFQTHQRDAAGRFTVRALKDTNATAPVAYADTATVNMGTSAEIDVLLNDRDFNGDSLTIQAVTQPTNGMVTINANQTIQFTASSSVEGTEAFTYQISDGSATSAFTTVTVQVTDPGFVDTDGDGLSDSLETQLGLDPNDASDAIPDADGDGVSNYDEYLAGTDPLVNDNGFSDAVLAGSPLALWELDETSGTTADDASTNALDGTYQGQYTLNQGSVLPTGAAAAFTDGLVTIPHDTRFEFTGDYTVEFLARWTEDGTALMVGKKSFAGHGFQVKSWYNGALQFVEDDQTAVWTQRKDLAEDEWHYIVAVRRGTTMEIWVDGELDNYNTSTQPSLANSAAVNIMGHWYHSWDVDGTMDTVAVHERALTPAEIKAHFKSMGDKDLDGVPTDVEIATFHDPIDANDATADYDGDGSSSYDEYVAGSDPMLNPQGFAAAITADNPEAHWPLEDVNTTAADSSGNNHAGTYHTPYTQSETGAITSGDSVSFTGGRIVVPSASGLHPQGDYTIEGYYKWSGTGWYGRLFGTYFGTSPYASPSVFANYGSSGQSDGKVYFRDSATASYGVASDASNLNDGTWRHFAFVRRGSVLEMYIDGLLESTVNLPSVIQHTATSDLYMMGRETFQQVQGSADEVAFYNHALSAGDIRQRVYQGQQPPPVVKAPGKALPANITRWLAQGDRIVLRDLVNSEAGDRWFIVDDQYNIRELEGEALQDQLIGETAILAVRDSKGVSVYFEDGLDDGAKQHRRLRGVAAPSLQQVASGGFDWTWTYTHDAVGNITKIVKPSGTEDYEYDTLDRLDAYTLPGSAEVTYAYDALGNRLSETQSGVVQTHTYASNSNRLATQAGLAVTFDAGGNTATDKGGARVFTYNNRNRLASVTDGGSNVGTFEYNAIGQRVRKVAGGVDTDYVYDLDGRLVGEYANGALVKEYVYFRGEPLAQIDASDVVYLHTDHLGTPRLGTDENQTQVWSWVADPFGDLAPNEDPDGDNTDTVVNLRFPGQYFDDGMGTHYNYFRDYEPSIGRYTTSDPIGLDGGVNRFSYARGNALSNIDPRGLSAIWVADGLIVVGGGILIYGAACSGTGHPWCEAVRTVGEICIDSIEDFLSPEVMNSWPLDKGGEEWGRRAGVGAQEGRRRAHNVKKRDPASKARDKWTVDPDSGDVYDPEGEVQGNLNDDYN